MSRLIVKELQVVSPLVPLVDLAICTRAQIVVSRRRVVSTEARHARPVRFLLRVFLGLKALELLHLYLF